MSSPLPAVQVLVAFQNNPCDDPALITTVASPGVLGGVNVWTDISAYVSTYQVSRGRQHELQQFEAGTCEFDLNNVDGRFSSWNTSGPYYGFLLPRKLVQVRVTWSAVVYKRFTGHVDAWPTVWADAQSNFAQLHASDAFRMFNLADITTGGYAAQVVTDGASGYWRLGDQVGSLQAADSSGNGHTGTVVTSGAGTVTYGQPGALPANVGTSALFVNTATTAIITLPASFAGSNVPGYSVEFWFMSTDTGTDAGTGGECSVSCKMGGVDIFLTLSVNGPGGSPFISWTDYSTILAFDESLYNSGWHHIVGTVAAAGPFILYVDGVALGSNANPPAGPSSAQNLIAASNVSPGSFMQEVAIYPSVLSPTQVANHYQLADFPQEGTGARINRVLNAINWSSGARAVDTGYSTVQTQTAALTTTTSLSHMQDVECTEGGALFMSGAGKVTFLSRQTLFSNALYITSQQTIGDNTAGGDLPFQPSPVLALDDLDLYNEATATRNGGVTQITDNQTSITAYGRVTWQPPATLIGISDTEVATLTEYIVYKFNTPVERLQSITVNLLELITPGTVADLLALDLLYRITVERTVVPGGGTAFSQVLNIEHIVETVTPDTWTVEFATALADPAWWILGTSALGTGTRLAY